MYSYLDDQREIYGADVVDRALARMRLTDETALQTDYETWAKLKRTIRKEEQRAINRRKFRRQQARDAARIRWHGHA